MSRVIRSLSVTLQPAGACDDCAWHCEPSAMTRDRVKDHVKATGHTVEVTRLTVDKYRPVGP